MGKCILIVVRNMVRQFTKVSKIAKSFLLVNVLTEELH